MAKPAKKPQTNEVPATKTTPAKKGRPSGAKNVEYDQAEVTLSACKKCGSTDRTPYGPNPQRINLAGVYIDPKTNLEYNVIVRRTTRCVKCGQARIDRTNEFQD